MKITSFLPVAFASLATAVPDFVIGTAITVSAKNAGQLASMTKAYVDAAISFQASMTAQPEWSSAISALREYQETGKNVPEDVTATDVILTYTTTPDWYNAMPTDLKNYFDNNRKKQEELRASVIASFKGDAARPMSLGIYVSGAVAALVVGVAVGL